MSPSEALRVSTVELNQERAARICGLISPDQMAKFACNPLSDLEIQAFDELSELSDDGIVSFRDKNYRIDDRLESGNSIRSVVELVEQDEAGFIRAKSANYITSPDGATYFEVHECLITPCSQIIEPEVGSPEIQTGDYTDMIIHALIACSDIVDTLQQVA